MTLAASTDPAVSGAGTAPALVPFVRCTALWIQVTGWWTSCLEILPSRERARGRF
jgi:hypothetical protein